KKVLDLQRKTMGFDHRDALVTRNYLGLLYEREGRYHDAEAMFTNLLEARRRGLGTRHAATIKVLVSLGAVQLEQQRYSAAEPVLREALAWYEDTKSNDWSRYHCQSLLGACLSGQRRYAEAEPLLLSGYDGMLQRRTTVPADGRDIISAAKTRI